MSDNFVGLHNHADSSTLDGLGKPEEFARKAKEMGQPGWALTDHGSLRGLRKAAEASKEIGIKLLPGIEAYFADDASRRGLTDAEKREIKKGATDAAAVKELIEAANAERKDRAHMTIWALNDIGLRNLYRLTSWAWTKGFYSYPRVDFTRLAEHSEGLAISTGCTPGGAIPKPLTRGNGRLARERMQRLAELFGDRLYVEIMPHVITENDGSQLPDISPTLLSLARDHGCRFIATQDAHYPHAEDNVAQDVMLAIQQKKKTSDRERISFSHGFWMRSRAEMEGAFARNIPGMTRAEVAQALDETCRLADRCTAVIEEARAGKYLVAPKLPEGVQNYDRWLGKLAREGVAKRFPGGLGEGYRARILHELEVIISLGFSSYFCSVWDGCRWAHEQGILLGPGRGSAGGSLVSYLLGITHLDPLEHGLSFSRFLSPWRGKMPDIDVDIEAGRRPELVNYFEETYGKDHVAHISTHVAMKGRGVLRSVGGACSAVDRRTAEVALLIPEQVEGDEDASDESAADVLRETVLGQEYARDYPDVAEVVGRLEGQIKGVGLHGGGIIISSVPVQDVVPLETSKGDRRVTTAWDKDGCEWAGLVKQDWLPLKMLTLIYRALEIAGLPAKAAYDIPLDDPNVFGVFSRGEFTGIFQYDTPSARRLCQGFVFERFSQIADMTALNRPGPMLTGIADQYLLGAKGGEIKLIHPIYDEIMAPTYGVMIYQEQLMALAQKLGGFTQERSDELRRLIAKKKAGISEMGDDFISGATERGMDEDRAVRLFSDVRGFGRYCFPNAHAAEYGALGVWSAWLKYYHTRAFYAAALEVQEEEQRQIRLASEARRSGIPVLPPDVRHSKASRWAVTPNGEIVGSLEGIRDIGPKAAEALEAAQPYTDLPHLLRTTKGSGVNIRTFERLAQAGALRGFTGGHDRWMAENAREIHPKLLRRSAPAGQMTLWAPEPIIPTTKPGKWPEKARVKLVSQVWPLYVDMEGRGLLEHVGEEVRAALDWPIMIPGDPALETPSAFGLIYGRVTRVRMRSAGEDKGQVSSVIITGEGGGEIQARADQDILDLTGNLLTKDGSLIVAACIRGPKGGTPSIDAAWSGEGAVSGEATGALGHLRKPRKTVPRDVRRAVGTMREEATRKIQGVVLRCRRHLTRKTKAQMATVGILGSTGLMRVLIFPSRMRKDIKGLEPGRLVQLRVKRLDDGGVHLADTPITFL